jgi:hypothetical protein
MTLDRLRKAANLTALERQFNDDQDEFPLAKVELSKRYWTRVAQILEGHSANAIKNHRMMLK